MSLANVSGSGPVPSTGHNRATRTLAILCLGYFMVLVDATIVSVATPALVDGLHASVTDVVWVTSAYLLAFAVPIPICGRLGDRYGVRRLYLLGLAVFTVASLVCGLVGSLGVLLAARVVQGLGASVMTPQITAYVTRAFPPSERGRAMAIWGATVGISTVIGPVLGGVLLDTLDWHWIFLLNVPAGAVAFVLAWVAVDELETHPHRTDLPGIGLSAIGVFLIVYAVQEGPHRGWDRVTWLMIAAGLVVIAALVGWEGTRAKEPLIPLQLFRDRNFGLGNIAIATMGLVIMAMIPLMIWAQVVRGLSPTRSGLILLPMALTTLVLAKPAGRLTDRVHPRSLIGAGLVASGLGVAALSWAMTTHGTVLATVPGSVVLGLGIACVMAPNSATANRNVPDEYAGAASGVYNLTRQLGSVVGAAVMAAAMEGFLSAKGVSGSAAESAAAGVKLPAAALDAANDALADTLLLTAALALIGVAAALAFERPSHLQRPAGPGEIPPPEPAAAVT